MAATPRPGATSPYDPTYDPRKKKPSVIDSAVSAARSVMQDPLGFAKGFASGVPAGMGIPLAPQAAARGIDSIGGAVKRGIGVMAGSPTNNPSSGPRVDPMARPAPIQAPAPAPAQAAPAQTGESPALTRLRAQAMQTELIRAKQAQYRDSDGNIQSRMSPEAEQIFRLNQEAKFAESAGRAVPGADAMGPPNRATSNMQAGFRDARAAEGALAAEWQRKRMDEAKYGQEATTATREADLAAIKNRTRMDEAGISGVEAETRFRNAAADKATGELTKPNFAEQGEQAGARRQAALQVAGVTPERLSSITGAAEQMKSAMSSLMKGTVVGAPYTGGAEEYAKGAQTLLDFVPELQNIATVDAELAASLARDLKNALPSANNDGGYDAGTFTPGSMANPFSAILSAWPGNVQNREDTANKLSRLMQELTAIAGQ